MAACVGGEVVFGSAVGSVVVVVVVVVGFFVFTTFITF